MKKIRQYLMNIVNREDICFIIVALIYFIMFLNVPITGDDVELSQQYVDLTWLDHWNLIVYDYLEWSSRVLVNFVIHVILGQNKVIWVTINALMAYILMKSLSKLFIKTNIKECNSVIACLFLLYPVQYIGESGWITASATYFWPISIGFLSLIPIRKQLDNQKMKWWEYVVYSLALVYAANEELMMVLIVASYLVYFLVDIAHEKKIHGYIMIQTLLAVVSIIFTLTAPGNGARGDSEITNWFREYKMLSFVDKVELGFSSTANSIWFGSYTVFIFACIILAVIIWKKYDDFITRMIAIVPSVVSIGCGPVKDITVKLFGKIEILTADISNIGLITVQNYNNLSTYIKFGCLCFFCILFIVDICLAFDKTYKCLAAVILLVAGTASRVALGFSPTIWASGFRTYSVMLFAIIAIGTIGYAELVEQDIFGLQKRRNYLYILYVFAIFSVVNSWFVIYS